MTPAAPRFRLRAGTAAQARFQAERTPEDMAMREGSLEAPTRHPIDWQSPDFWDEAKLEAELRRDGWLAR